MNHGTNNFNIINGKEYFIEWSFNDNRKIEVEIIKKLSFEDMIGRYKAKKTYK
jgi:AAA+ superfamily predicted ATPase